MEIHESARKHGIADADIEHAATHHLHESEAGEEPRRVLYLGPDRAGNLLEVVVIVRDDASELVIHAMAMRRKYESLLRGDGDG
jgi:hypothetical protein